MNGLTFAARRRIGSIQSATGATRQEAERALRDHGWDVSAAIDFIRRKMPIKAKEVSDGR